MLRQSLLTAAQFAVQAVPSKASIPILETLLIEATDGKGRATGTNMDLFASHEFECDVDLKCCVAAKRLLNILSNAAYDEITIEPGDKQIVIRSGKSRSVIETLAAKDFPTWDEIKGQRFAIPAESIKKCLPAMSTDTSRINLCSVFLDEEGYVVATDGRRMHFIKQPDKFPCPVIIPSNVASLLSDMEGVMKCDGKKIYAEGDGWSVSAKITEGGYGKWRAMMLKTGKKFPVPDDFASVIKRTAASSSEQNCARVDFSRGQISSRNHEDELDLDLGFNFGLNPAYILPAVKEAGEKATIAASGDNKAILVENGDFTAVVAIMFAVAQ